MRIPFEVAGVSVEFWRSHWTGRTRLNVGGRVTVLQSVLDPSTHISFSLAKVWTHEVAGHEVLIGYTRPLFLPAFRPFTYLVMVDGQTIIQRRGY